MKAARLPLRQRSARGFTLAELAIATAIIGLLLGGMFVTLSTQIEIRQISETQKTLEQAREALIGFVLANGRLPCPAAPAAAGAGAGTESPAVVTGTCDYKWTGYLPGTTLGIAPVDAQGYVLDAWGHRIRYAVTDKITGACGTPCFTTASMVRTEFQNATLAPDLAVCSTSTGMTNVGTATAACAVGSELTTNAIAVVFSRGKNALITGGSGADEARNADTDRAFVWHEKVDPGAANGEYDDIMIWLSPNTLYVRMASAGVL